MLLPEKNHGIIVLTNSLGGKWAFRAITNTLLDQLLDTPKTDWIEHYQNCHNKTTTPCIAQSTSQEKELYIGSYFHPAYGQLHVIDHQDELHIAYHDILIPLAQATEDLFYGSIDHLGLTLPFHFSSEENGAIAELHVPCLKNHPLVPFKKS